jgi:metal-responsive CopG/Arc/MetJ family transcriptional regulator
LADVDKFMKENSQLRYTSREELIQEAIRRELTGLLDKEKIGLRGRSSGKE